MNVNLFPQKEEYKTVDEFIDTGFSIYTQTNKYDFISREGKLFFECNQVFAILSTIYFTRKNVQSIKYIETVTLQRIKWLGIIRNDISDLCSDLIILTNSVTKGIEIRQQQEQIQSETIFDEKNKEFEYIQQTVHDDERKLKLIKTIYIIQLRLNPEEDKEIIDMLNEIRSVIQKSRYEIHEINKCSEIIEPLIHKVQLILKIEWEKVKKEAVKGKVIK